MHVRRLGTLVEISAPAKINLFLEVLARREDGFHEIETLMAAVGIHDTLVLVPHPEVEITLDCRWALGIEVRDTAERRRRASEESQIDSVPTGPANLVWRALDLLRQRTGYRGGAAVTLVKRIPAAAGLGGASSDAAAALLAANQAWQLGLSAGQLAQIAADLGSDIPFFLTGGAAVCRGRGERIEPTAATRLYVVVVRPPVGLSTPKVYQGCRPADSPRSINEILKPLARGHVAAASKCLTNRLQAPAARLTEWIERLQNEFQPLGCLGHQMSGSGSSYFGICRSTRHARRVASQLRSRGFSTVYATSTTTH